MRIRQFQISEDDLAVLEDSLPLLYSEGADYAILNERGDLRDAWRQVKEILSNVRWGYGPHDRIDTLA